MKFIFITIVAGITGFVVCVLLLLYANEKSPFFEITIADKTKHVDTILTTRIKNLKKEILATNESIARVDAALVKAEAEKSNRASKIKLEKTEYESKLKKAKELLQSTIKDRNELMAYNKDTAQNFHASYISVDRNALFRALNQEDFKKDSLSLVKSISFQTIDPVLATSEEEYKNVIAGQTHLRLEKFESKMAFFNKYPTFGIWMVLSIAQMSLWFIIATLIFFMAYDVLK